eukprot:171598-Pelagomonas_calceolata.AAC.1
MAHVACSITVFQEESFHYEAAKESANGDFGEWNHSALEPGCEKYHCFHCIPSSKKLVGIRNRMGIMVMMKLTSKSNGTLVVKSKLFELVKGMPLAVLSVTGCTNTHKYGKQKVDNHY